MNQQTENQEWVILEAMGRNRVAGRYYEENGLHRVDIPDISPDADPDKFIRTERYGNAAIFRITTVDEETARLIAQQCVIPEAIPWDMRQELTKIVAPQEPIEALPEDGYEFDDDAKEINL